MSDSTEFRSTKKGVDALIERVNSRFPSSVTPSTRIEIHPSEWLEVAAEVAELRRDAERYRWLRDHWWLDDKADATPAPMMNAQSPEQFDAAIDAALGDSRDA